MTLKKPTPQRTGAWLTTIALAASLVACGGSSSSSSSGGSAAPDPLQPYRQQALQWAPCDTTILGSPEEKVGKYWEQLGGRLQCSTMRAPMDWAQPDRSDVFVSVMRVATADPTQRRGAMLFNPGGPGVDGLGDALSLFIAFGQSNPESEQGALQLRLLDSYDMVGFSPRGVGASTRLQCATNEIERENDGSVTDANLANVAYNSRKEAEACLRNPLTPYINTDATARDMDLLRELLGEDKLNYVGYSYGTWLGGWYASLFPEKVGRMVLDSSQDFTTTHEEATLAMAPARQRLHDEVLLAYAARHANYFQLGSSQAEVSAVLQAFSPDMFGVLRASLSGLTYGSGKADAYWETVSVMRGLDTVLKAVPDSKDSAAVQAALQQQVFVLNDSERNQSLREQAQELYGNFSFESKPESISFKGAPYWAVSCNDTSATTDVQAWNAIVRSTVLSAPLFFDIAFQNPCAYWSGPRVTKPNVAAMKGLDVLMVQSQYDSATPTEGANRFFAQLPSARRVYVPGEYQHGVFPYSDSCVDTTVVRYLLGETPKERETTCQANPLEQDAVAAAAAVAAPSSRGSRLAGAPGSSSGVEPPTYLNPEEAQKLIDRFKDGIRLGR